MPIYEFECRACKTQFEEVILKEGEAVRCPQCNSSEVKKLLSTGSFVTGGPIVVGKPGANAITSRGTSPCASCRGGNCSTCSSK
ncbi:FmdB family zinc ribbon protein [Desulfoplanes sp. PS50]|jgi:putative FmdB family regulatory protein